MSFEDSLCVFSLQYNLTIDIDRIVTPRLSARYIQALLSLVELVLYFTLIG